MTKIGAEEAMPDDINKTAQSVAPGQARCPGPSWDDYMATDTRTVPAALKGEHYEFMGSEPLDTDRYVGPAFFQKEVEKMWPNVWQFAAREEELPEPGDYVVYENVGRSFLLTRQPDGSVKAFYNVCLHRARKLRTESGWADDFKCPFHGFAWHTDGALKEIPCKWDFPHLNADNMQLPEASVGRWGGYIFIREAEEGPSLEEFLAPLPELFKDWAIEETYTAVWVGKVIKANWKAAAEAFMEAWHTIETHPQLLDYLGDANTKYNIYSDNVNVALTPYIVMSPHIDPTGKTEQWILDRAVERTRMESLPGYTKPVLKPGELARQAMAESNRQLYGTATGRDYSQRSDTEMVDIFTYNVFPNLSPWGGLTPNLVYRWRPWPDHEHTLMEVRILLRAPVGEPIPRAPRMTLLGEDQAWSSLPELGGLGPVFDQDMENLPYVQEGMKASKNKQLHLGNYQEIRVRHLNRTLDKYLAKP
jgi:phenylpropionate dioxygenase-like ring-hydroxylating dioxygenase large terminal subunit